MKLRSSVQRIDTLDIAALRARIENGTLNATEIILRNLSKKHRNKLVSVILAHTMKVVVMILIIRVSIMEQNLAQKLKLRTYKMKGLYGSKSF